MYYGVRVVERGANCVFGWGSIGRERFVVSAFLDFSYEIDGSDVSDKVVDTPWWRGDTSKVF